MATFVVAGLGALALFLAGAILVLRDLAEAEALRDARQFATLSGQGIVEPALRDAIVAGETAALRAVDRVVQERVLGPRIVRVKIWSLDGRVVYSDEPRTIGVRYALDEEKLEALRLGEARAELSDLSGPENRFERGLGELYEVYLPIRTPNGTPLLFETYQRAEEVSSIGRRIWLPLTALVLASLVLLWLVQIPLAWRLADRVRRGREEREQLLERTVDASRDERRRIAAELHDGVVQDLAGLSYSLSAAAERAPEGTPAELRAALAQAASATRDTMRRLRSLLLDIHPPSLRAAGLEAALADLVGPLAAQGIAVELEVDETPPLPEDLEQLVYRAAGEAIRNVRKHARASRVSVRLRASNGVVRLEVVDDGVGFAPEERERKRAEGHVGLALVEELARRQHGALEVSSEPGGGTRFALEVPS
ncbi:MAG: histidine kinase [Thermoleophilia bacterium]|nr:histidine kinase [Gaiellaceae bacterium]MDW8337688.1 histidine kinase [Thermoleophilia bacterium]